MSKSYKKVPISKTKYGSRQAKKQANKKVRATDELFQRGKYKKVFDQWIIYDYTSYWPWDEALENWLSTTDSWYSKHFKTIDEFRNWWEKIMIRK